MWFENQAKEAAEFYCSLFNNSRITSAGDMLVEFVLDGTNFIALNGGPQFKFSEAISFFVLCDDQEEVDRLWNKLSTDGGKAGRCSWCTDKFGVSWQIVPKRFTEMMKTGTPEQTHRLMTAMMKMNKMIIEDLEKAFNNEP